MPLTLKRASEIEHIYCSIAQIQLHSHSYEIVGVEREIEIPDNEPPQSQEKKSTASKILSEGEPPGSNPRRRRKSPTQAPKPKPPRKQLITEKQIKKKSDPCKYFSGFIVTNDDGQIFILTETNALIHLNKGITNVNIKFGIKRNEIYDLMTLDINYIDLIEKIALIKEAYVLIDIKSLIDDRLKEFSDALNIYYIGTNKNIISQKIINGNGQMVSIYHPKLLENKFTNPVIRVSQLLFNETGVYDFAKYEKERALSGAPIFCVSDQSFEFMGFIDHVDEYITYMKSELIKI